ncbi:hypothetical protein [Chania multitudinisentens]|uniref:hypothetical protein n=1 Tax=Chania multitudinisentens TaxID=1639108 RepID=UPI000467C607
MQPLSGPGAPNPLNPPPLQNSTVHPDAPLSPAQRTQLEKLVLKIMALSPAGSVALTTASQQR